jgi:hypothetical protein
MLVECMQARARAAAREAAERAWRARRAEEAAARAAQTVRPHRLAAACLPHSRAGWLAGWLRACVRVSWSRHHHHHSSVCAFCAVLGCSGACVRTPHLGYTPACRPTHLPACLPQRTKARLQPCLKKYTIVYFCAESVAGSREPQRNRLGAESALADALGVHVRQGEALLGGVGRHSTDAELRAAWRRTVLRHHPDRHVGAGAAVAAMHAKQFAQAREAYESLCTQRGLRP